MATFEVIENEEEDIVQQIDGPVRLMVYAKDYFEPPVEGIGYILVAFPDPIHGLNHRLFKFDLKLAQEEHWGFPLIKAAVKYFFFEYFEVDEFLMSVSEDIQSSYQQPQYIEVVKTEESITLEPNLFTQPNLPGRA